MSVSVPEGVLNDILSRLDTLEANSGQRPPANETLVPNYLTVDALGRAGAAFTGFITAMGLIMLGGLGSTNSIRWLNAAGNPIAQLDAFEPLTNGSQLDVQSHSYGGQDSLARLLSFIDGGPSAQVNTKASTVDANTSVLIQAFGSGPTFTRKLIDAAGASDYLQLASTGQLAFAWGVATAVFAGVTSVTVAGINPALGRNVKAIIALPDSSDVRLDYAGSIGAATFSLRFASTIGVASGTYHAAWFVVG